MTGKELASNLRLWVEYVLIEENGDADLLVIYSHQNAPSPEKEYITNRSQSPFSSIRTFSTHTLRLSANSFPVIIAPHLIPYQHTVQYICNVELNYSEICLHKSIPISHPANTQ